MWIWIAVMVVLAGLAFVRLAPSDTARWHVDVPFHEDKDFAGGALRVVNADLEALNRIILDSGAQLVAGSLAEGHVTYVNRSLWIGFPDYTTVQQVGDTLAIYARLRFGTSDFGVNRNRIEGWLAQI